MGAKSNLPKKPKKGFLKNSPDANSIALKLQQGIALHQAGDLERARSKYQELLKSDPQNFNALQLSGAIELQTEQWEKALGFLIKAIKINDRHAFVFYNLGNAFKGLGRLNEALTSYSRAITLKRDYAEAYYNQGLALKELKRLEEALRSYKKAAEIKHDYAEAHLNCGNILLDLKRFDEAISSYQKAIESKTNYAEAYSYCGIALKELQRLDEALISCEKAIELRHDHADAHSNLGDVLKEIKRFDEALSCYEKAIELRPDFAEAYSNRGIALQELKRLEDALSSYNQALMLKQDFEVAHSNRGNVLVDLRRMDDALKSFDKAITLNPSFSEARFNKSLVLLLMGYFDSGLEEYEWRPRIGHSQDALARKISQTPLWLGDASLVGKTILLYGEQGFGDSIQFCRYARLVKNLGAKVFLRVPKPLFALLTGLKGVDEILDDEQPLSDFDYHCPLMSLPLAFKTNLKCIPCPTTYLNSIEGKRRGWDSTLGSKAKPRIGLVWSGNSTHKNDGNRSLPLKTLIDFLPQEFEYISLQKEVREDDFDTLRNSTIKHFSDHLKDFTDTAALCDLMDLVVTVDTSVAHLAGALGKKTWILLPYVPDWRWLLDRTDSPWYESVRLYRQGEERQYETVIQQVAFDLRERLL